MNYNTEKIQQIATEVANLVQKSNYQEKTAKQEF